MRSRTYGSRDEEAGEDVPNCVERGGENGTNVDIRCHGHGHHPVEGEVQKCEEHEEQVPEEFRWFPVETDAAIYDGTIYDSLEENVGDLNHDL